MTNKFSLFCLLSFLTFLVACKKEEAPAPPTVPTDPNLPAAKDNQPLLFGNPTNAVKDANESENYLIDQTWFVEAYSESRGIPVWVAWHLESSDIGSTSRQDDFRPDTKLPAGWYQVQSSSYSGSGFDRGHNCPSADRTLSVPANSSTFLMTNMIPQAPTFNQGPWEGMESYVRNTLVGSAKEAFIFMGNYGNGGVGSLGSLVNTINSGRVAVPSHVWKIAIIIPKGNNDLSRLDTSAIVLAVNMPNDNRVYNTTSTGKSAWRSYVTTITGIEQQSAAKGVPLNFLSAVNASVKTYLKAKQFR